MKKIEVGCRVMVIKDPSMIDLWKTAIVIKYIPPYQEVIYENYTFLAFEEGSWIIESEGGLFTVDSDNGRQFKIPYGNYTQDSLLRIDEDFDEDDSNIYSKDKEKENG